MKNSFQGINEKETRKKNINLLLKSVAWKSSFIKEEVNPVKSDFKNKNYIYNSQSEKKDLFIDYLLLDEHENPLAIIEAKKFSKNP
jgi:type I restriction enzyme R subunit